MTAVPVNIRSLPGIKRDGTQFDGNNYIDALWCRFQRGLPRKMGGFRAATSQIPEKIYGMHVYSENGTQYAHLGGANSLSQVLLDQFGNLIGFNPRLPGGFVASSNNVWQFDILFDDTGGGANKLIAHAAPNLAAIDSNVERAIWFGDLTAAGALIATGMAPQSGGIVVLAPFLLGFGNAGRIQVSAEADPGGVPLGVANVCGTKIVRGFPLRGGGSGPAGIFWALDSVIRATFDAALSPIPFAFDTFSSQQSILSSRSVIEYDGIWYWLAVDRPLMFNGVIQRVPNDMNVNWFYDNLNFQQRQKVFAFKVPKYGEIWWCFPYGNATECTHALVYNVDGRFWYDTALPTTDQAGQGRTDGYFAQVYSKPFMMDQVNTSTPGYTLWQHETGTDSINGASIQPVRSYFKTHELSLLTQEKAIDKSVRVGLLEPDFVQSGNLTMVVEGRANARALTVTSETFTITPVASTPEEENIPLKEVRRLMSFKFESNVAGGDYQLGQTLAHIEPGDGRQRS